MLLTVEHNSSPSGRHDPIARTPTQQGWQWDSLAADDTETRDAFPGRCSAGTAEGGTATVSTPQPSRLHAETTTAVAGTNADRKTEKQHHAVVGILIVGYKPPIHEGKGILSHECVSGICRRMPYSDDSRGGGGPHSCTYHSTADQP